MVLFASHVMFALYCACVRACVLCRYHFVSNDYPFMGETLFQLFEIIGRGEYTMPSGLSEPLEDLIRGKRYWLCFHVYVHVLVLLKFV